MLRFLGSSRCLHRLRGLHNDCGATAVEYGLIVVLIAAVIAGVVLILGQQVVDDFQAVLTNW